MATLSTAHPSPHFAPDSARDPQEQRRLRALLEKIDLAAYEANRSVIAHALGRTDIHVFKKLATAAAQARARWVTAAIALAEQNAAPSAEQTQKVAGLRHAYEELSSSYEALRRMVERGYLMFTSV